MARERSTPRFRSDFVSFEVDFLGGGGYCTQSTGVDPGDHVRMDIQP